MRQLLGGVVEQHAAQAVAGVLRADQVRERQRHLLGRREAVLAVEDHAVAAIEHQHRGAGALVFALVHVQVGIFQIERHLGAFAPDGGKERLADVEIQRVAELVALRGSGGLDAGGQIARIVAAEARLAERAEQVLERFEAEEIERFVGDLELDLGLLAAANARGAGALLRGLFDRDLPFVDHLLDQVIEQLLHLLRRHLWSRSIISSMASLSKSLPCSSACWMACFRSSSVCWFHSLKGMYWVLKPLSSRKSDSACSRSSASMPRSSPV